MRPFVVCKKVLCYFFAAAFFAGAFFAAVAFFAGAFFPGAFSSDFCASSMALSETVIEVSGACVSSYSSLLLGRMALRTIPKIAAQARPPNSKFALPIANLMG